MRAVFGERGAGSLWQSVGGNSGVGPIIWAGQCCVWPVEAATPRELPCVEWADR